MFGVLACNDCDGCVLRMCVVLAGVMRQRSCGYASGFIDLVGFAALSFGLGFGLMDCYTVLDSSWFGLCLRFVVVWDVELWLIVLVLCWEL